jgi:uncharacterized protein (DUF58 family)
LIHWKTTAKRGDLIVREFEAQQSGRIALLLDTMADPADEPSLARRELAISLAATIARNAARLGYEVSLLACDDRVHGIRPGRGMGHLARVLDGLALLGDNPATTLEQAVRRCDPAVLRGAYGIVIGSSAGGGLAGFSPRRLRPLMAAVAGIDVSDPLLHRVFRLEGPPGAPATAAPRRSARRGKGTAAALAAAGEGRP